MSIQSISIRSFEQNNSVLTGAMSCVNAGFAMAISLNSRKLAQVQELLSRLTPDIRAAYPENVLQCEMWASRLSISLRFLKGATILSNLALRGGVVYEGIRQGKYFSVACHVAAFTALFFSHGILISIGIDLMGQGVRYFRPTPEPLQINLSPTGENIFITRNGTKSLGSGEGGAPLYLMGSCIRLNSQEPVPASKLEEKVFERSGHALKLAESVQVNLMEAASSNHIPEVVVLGYPPNSQLAGLSFFGQDLRDKGVQEVLVLPVGKAIEQYKNRVSEGKHVIAFFQATE